MRHPLTLELVKAEHTVLYQKRSQCSTAVPVKQGETQFVFCYHEMPYHCLLKLKQSKEHLPFSLPNMGLSLASPKAFLQWNKVPKDSNHSSYQHQEQWPQHSCCPHVQKTYNIQSTRLWAFMKGKKLCQIRLQCSISWNTLAVHRNAQPW